MRVRVCVCVCVCVRMYRKLQKHQVNASRYLHWPCILSTSIFKSFGSYTLFHLAGHFYGPKKSCTLGTPLLAMVLTTWQNKRISHRPCFSVSALHSLSFRENVGTLWDRLIDKWYCYTITTTTNSFLSTYRMPRRYANTAIAYAIFKQKCPSFSHLLSYVCITAHTPYVFSEL